MSEKLKVKSEKLNTFNGETKNIPQEAFNFNSGTATFAIGKEGEKDKARLQLYDGGINKHWYWGNFAFDLATMKLAKKTVPMLFDHDTTRRAGFGQKADIENGFALEGPLLDNDEVSRFKADSEKGFPFESSLRFDPERSKLLYVREGQTTMVNGKELKGPGTVVQNAVIMEGSICVFGALNNCKTEVFELENTGKEKAMEDVKATMTVDTFKADQPALHQSVFDAGVADGQKKAVELFTAIAAACGSDHELACQMFTEGKSAADALAARNVKLEAELAAAKAAKPLAKIETAEIKKVDPAKTEFSDTQEDVKTAEPDTEEGWKRKFEADKEIQAVFGNNEKGLKTFIAAQKAKAKGIVNIHGLK